MNHDTTPTTGPLSDDAAATHVTDVGSRRGLLALMRDAVGASVGAILALLPHVLHHIGLIAGTALVTGAGGNALFFGIGLIFSIPLLRRLYRRFHTWWAPTIAVVVFAVVFALSAFVIGPAVSGADGSPSAPGPSPTQDHSGHHG